jgi:DNA polymerase-3 subunit gamma/tau
MTLYRKYRPQTFAEVLGQDQVTSLLEAAVKTDKVAHAYLFSGSRGIGKTSIARILAKAINCQKRAQGRDGLPCNECAHCLAINQGSFLDVIELDAASNRGIDEIRQLKEGVAVSPVLGERKVYILDEVHMLTTEAFNALLKTLEEPPSHVVFILCTTETHKVPVTIASRCQRLTFVRASVPDIEAQLRHLARAEQANVDDQALSLIAQLADGGFRDAAMLLEQMIVSHLDGEKNQTTTVTRQDVERRLGLPSGELLDQLVVAHLAGQAEQAIAAIEAFVASGGDVAALTARLIQRLRLMLYAKVSPSAAAALVDATELKHLQQQTSHISVARLTQAIRALVQATTKRHESHAALGLELAILDMKPEETSQGSEGQSTTKEVSDLQPEAKKARVADSQSLPPAPVNLVPAKPQESKPEIPAPETAQPAPVKEQTITVEVVQGSQAINAAQLLEAWTVILQQVKLKSRIVEALLRNCTPLSFDGTILLLQFWFAIHKEKLEQDKNRRLLEEVAGDVLGAKLKVACQLGDKEKRPRKRPMSEEDVHNVAPVEPSEDLADVAAEIFGGEFVD